MLETVCSLALWIGLGESRQNEIIAVETKEGLLIGDHLMVYPPGEKRVVKWCNCTETTHNSDNCF